jgi:hypothetical protein
MGNFTQKKLSTLRLGGGSVLSASLVAALVMTAMPVSEAEAADLIYSPGPSNCTRTNCVGPVLNGISMKNINGDSISFTTQVFADAGECVRLDVTNEDVPMKMVLVSPSGTFWPNDGRTAADPRPLIMARADVRGYYTVQINVSPKSQQPVNSLQGFTLDYGRYVYGNAFNCPSPIR